MVATAEHNGTHSSRLNPLQFALWASLAGISMMFGALLSAYIVRQAAGNWLEFVLPWQFMASTIVIIGSSVTAHFTLQHFKNSNERPYKRLLILTALLGVLFIIFQYKGWNAMLAQGIDLKGNPSGAFVYVISGLHVAHVLAGLAAFVVAMIHGFGLAFVPNERRINRLILTVQYWHFVDILWIVLFLFLTFYR